MSKGSLNYLSTYLLNILNRICFACSEYDQSILLHAVYSMRCNVGHLASLLLQSDFARSRAWHEVEFCTFWHFVDEQYFPFLQDHKRLSCTGGRPRLQSIDDGICDFKSSGGQIVGSLHNGIQRVHILRSHHHGIRRAVNSRIQLCRPNELSYPALHTSSTPSAISNPFIVI